MEHTLTDPAPSDYNEFGVQVALDGSLRAITSDTSTQVIIFHGNSYIQTLTETGAVKFGNAMDVYYDVGNAKRWVFVGSPLDDNGGTDRGSAYIYLNSSTTYNLYQKITAPDPADSQYFGSSVRYDHTTGLLYIGASGHSSGGGVCYIYKNNGDEFQLEQIIGPKTAGYSFGELLDADNGSMVTSAVGDTFAGIAYFYNS